jgi:hypothetical protein
VDGEPDSSIEVVDRDVAAERKLRRREIDRHRVALDPDARGGGRQDRDEAEVVRCGRAPAQLDRVEVPAVLELLGISPDRGVDRGDQRRAGAEERVGLDAVIWRSPDGRAWERIAVLDLGDRAREIPELGPLAASKSGSLVLGWVNRFDGPNGVHSSRDAITWEQVAPTEFGQGERFGHPSQMDLVATDAGFLLLGKGCEGCPARAYMSGNGQTWELAGEIDLPNLRHISLATDGRRTVAALGA